MADVRDKYNIAINDVGYMLRGAPGKVGYSRSIVPSQVNRMAISDLAYSDFAGQGLFYLAQTDWNAGIKTERVWRDDAKFYYSTNINAFSEQGKIKLGLDTTLQVALSADNIPINCGTTCKISGAYKKYIGTDDDPVSDKAIVYRVNDDGTWIDISSTVFGTTNNLVSQLLGHKDNLWVITWGGVATYVISYYDGSAWTDISATAQTATSANMKHMHAMCEDGNTIYLAGSDGTALKTYIMSSADEGVTITKEVTFDNDDITILDMIIYDGDLYYLSYLNKTIELRSYTVSETSPVDLNVATFYNCTYANVTGYGGNGGRMLFNDGSKLIITIPPKFIYSYDLTTLAKIFERDATKHAIGSEASVEIRYGGTQNDNKIYWGNLVYDGEEFFNYTKNISDSTSDVLYPLFSDNNNDIFWHSDWDPTTTWTRIWQEDYDGGLYKSGTDKNFLVFSEMAPITAIDKLFDSITVMYDVSDTNESIKIKYSIDNMSTWTTIGTISNSADGSTTKKTFKIPGSIIFNKIWFKVYLNGDGTSTPELLDLIMVYRPMPDYKNRWDMRLNFSDAVNLLNSQQEQRTGQELNAELWNEKVTKQTVVFKDIDYIQCDLVSAMSLTATSALVDSTKRFPRRGRIRAVSGSVAEEMTYTSARTNKLLGISRAKRGTTAKAYAAGQQLDSGYDVYVEDIRSEVNFTDENKTEHIAQVLLIES